MAAPQESRSRGLTLVEDGVGAAISAVEEPEQAGLTSTENAADILPSPERRLRLTKVITISGPSFSGKDSVVRILAERHGWKVYDGTEDGFQRRREGSGEAIGRPRQEHISFDEGQARRFRELNSGDEMWIHQTRLGGIILAAEIDRRNTQLTSQENKMRDGSVPTEKIEQIPAVSILLWTSAKVRQNRAVQHAREKARRDGTPIPTRAHVLAEMKRKELNETKSWRKKYGSVRIGRNPYSRDLRRRNNNAVYNRYIVTDDLTVEQVADRVEEMALQTGAAEIIQEPQTPIEMQPNTEVVLADESLEAGEPIPYGASQTDTPFVDIPKSRPTLKPA